MGYCLSYPAPSDQAVSSNSSKVSNELMVLTPDPGPLDGFVLGPERGTTICLLSTVMAAEMSIISQEDGHEQ